MANILKNFINNNKLKATSVYYDINTSLLEAIFPIGRGFIDFTNTDYSTYLGFTWERELVGMVGVGLDVNQSEFNQIGKTGGEKTHTLNGNEIPSCIPRTRQATAGQWSLGAWGNHNANDDAWVCNLPGQYDTPIGEQSHNNLQPYKVVAYWKRVA